MNAGGVDKACKSNAQHHFLDLKDNDKINAMWFVYIVQHTKTKQIYIGRTNDIKRRLEEHNLGKTYATRRKAGKWILIYSEVYRDKKDATLREIRLKQHGRAKQELLKRIRHSLL